MLPGRILPKHWKRPWGLPTRLKDGCGYEQIAAWTTDVLPHSFYDLWWKGPDEDHAKSQTAWLHPSRYPRFRRTRPWQPQQLQQPRQPWRREPPKHLERIRMSAKTQTERPTASLELHSQTRKIQRGQAERQCLLGRSARADRHNPFARAPPPVRRQPLTKRPDRRWRHRRLRQAERLPVESNRPDAPDDRLRWPRIVQQHRSPPEPGNQ